jgi:hypothetical protein
LLFKFLESFPKIAIETEATTRFPDRVFVTLLRVIDNRDLNISRHCCCLIWSWYCNTDLLTQLALKKN